MVDLETMSAGLHLPGAPLNYIPIGYLRRPLRGIYDCKIDAGCYPPPRLHPKKHVPITVVGIPY